MKSAGRAAVYARITWLGDSGQVTVMWQPCPGGAAAYRPAGPDASAERRGRVFEIRELPDRVGVTSVESWMKS